MGDSYTDFGHYQTTATSRTISQAYTQGITDLLMGRIRNDPATENWGIAGQNIAQVLARMPTIISEAQARGVKLLVIPVGKNDEGMAGNPTPFADQISGLQQIWDLAAAAGLGVLDMIQPWRITAQGGWSGSFTAADITARKNLIDQVAAWRLAQNGRRPNFRSIDTRPLLADPGMDRESYSWSMADGVHPVWCGTYFMSKAGAAEVYPLLSTPSPIVADDTGNLITNGVLAGTAGGKGANVSGSIADGWQAQLVAGSGATYASGSVVASKASYTSKTGQVLPSQRFDFSNLLYTGGAGSNIWLNRTMTLDNALPAGNYRLLVPYRIVSPGNMRGPFVRITENDGASAFQYNQSAPNSGAGTLREGYEGCICGENIAVRAYSGSGTRSLQVIISTTMDQAAVPLTGSIEFGPVSLRAA
ncbi:hypothetical protein RGI145_12300 [Roseomonas gilardii]|uniref:Uncharacterized protein n=1 Tax=Roseomonas gilardii TaxID=257708 RepID=A0A1L7AG70_9PROT|nr:hypothetical protein [Roseomonas gilardii]APT57775.1 hypothetical protein RGI145_12300 [Roseomonas gilardii]